MRSSIRLFSLHALYALQYLLIKIYCSGPLAICPQLESYLSLIALQDARFSAAGRFETSRGQVCRGSGLINRKLKQRRFWDGRRIRLPLARFNANLQTVRSAFQHFKPNCTDQKGVLNSRSKNFSLPAAVCVPKRWFLKPSFISPRPLEDLSPVCVSPSPILFRGLNKSAY